MPITTKEELNKCRNRVNPIIDETQVTTTADVADDYVCTPVKARKNDLEHDDWLSQQIKESWDD